MRSSAPPLSRTARLCPLFSSTSSLYISELLVGGSGGPPEEEEEEEEEAPTTCWEKHMDRFQTDLSTATKPRSQEDGRNRSVAFTSTAVFTPTLLADRSASFTVVTRVS